ncbi:formate/nitrite transporter family protein [Sphingobacterium bambusae]|uniref:Formate/nitrite transporter family protein n=1 Tax=Sphingobacterium bambusae TaxID=662858 RepID=A0ABW6BEF7_9SPHI|nr:formate/nitrite transporter family protein [Sphingobacterium bambusae]WPL48838.1 formate/nitrite transporter family protein [Sphingobacterium bambusae]
MDYITPKEVADNMMTTAIYKSQLRITDLLIRGALSGALLAISVTLALMATTQTSLSLMGAFVFPVGFVIIIILGLELVTGSFALVPLAYMEKHISGLKMLENLFWVFVGNLIGSLLFAVLFWAASTESGQLKEIGIIEQAMVSIAEKKTTGYASHGAPGLFSAFVKAILCNWMVCMGVIMSMTSKSTLGKILAAGIPIFIFFALGYEHAVVNMFVIPAGMMFGAKVTVSDWWLYNQFIVTAGNIVGGLLFTGMAIYYTHTSKEHRLSSK